MYKSKMQNKTATIAANSHKIRKQPNRLTPIQMKRINLMVRILLI